MSLVRIAARISVVQALKGRTLVQDHVLDSKIDAFDVAADGTARTDEERQFIAVYTDTAKIDGDDASLRSFSANGDTEFVFIAGVATPHTATNQETGESEVYPGIPGTDAAFEVYLDLVMRQIGDALADPANAWAEIFRKFVARFVKMELTCTSGGESGERLAAQQLRVTAVLRPDPVRGAPLKDTHPLAMFFAKAATLTVPNPDHDPDDPDSPASIPDPVVTAQVALMQAQLAGTPFSWELDIARYGMTRTEADNLLLVPPDGAEADIEVVDINTAPATPDGGAP